MHKCPKCGKEFEGKFCPDCGTQWQDEKTCPNCGAKLDGSARFCNECGYAFYQTPQPAATVKQNYKVLGTVYSILKYIPALLFALFSVLLFAFYAAPVAVLPAQSFMGEKIPAESYGNVYSMFSGILSEVPELKNAMVSLIVFASVTLAFGIALLFIEFLPHIKNKQVYAKLNLTVEKLLNCIGFVFYFIFFVIGCVICGKISSADEGMEVIAAGACPILLIVFSLIFALLGAASIFARNFLKKRNSALSQAEENKLQLQKEAEINRREEYYKTHTPPVMPERATKKQACIYKHEKRRYDNAKDGATPSAVIWLDLNKIWLTVVALIIIVTIIVFVCVMPNPNGTYYRVRGGVLDENTYFIIKSDKWENEDGETGDFKKDGDNVIFYYTMFGETEEIADGTLKDYVLTVNGDTYVSEKHKHNYGEWQTLRKATCVAEGLNTRTCACGVIETDNTPSLGGHDYQNYICTRCGEKHPDYYASKGLAFKISNGNYTVVGIGECEDTDIIIPTTYNNKPVTAIGSNAFEGCNSITSVTIPDRLLSIGDHAFANCSALTSATIGNDVTSISDCIFYNCVSLINVTLGNRIDKIDYKTFYNCYNLKDIIIPNSVKSIVEYAFDSCSGLTSITIPDSVTSIGSSAFVDCRGLTSIAIGNSVTSIGNSAFDGCFKLVEVYNLSTLTITAGASGNGGVAYYALNVYKPVSEMSKLATTSDGYIFYEDGDIVYLIGYTGTQNSLTLPNNYNGKNYEIYQYAFYKCSLTSVTIPDSVTSIGSSAFSGCTSLTSVTIGNSVTSIGNSAFSGCTSLTSVTIGNSVTSIGNSAFEYCYKLVEVYNLSKLSISTGSSRNGYVAYYALNVYTSLSAKSKLATTSDGYVFYEDGDIVYLMGYIGTHISLTLPDNYNGKNYEIYQYAFYGCKDLTSINMPDSVTSIGNYAFSSCSSLTSVTIPDGVTSIGNAAFYDCYNLTSVTIPDGVTSIGYSAFNYCRSLTSITIGNSVTSIGYEAFYNCSSLESVYWNATNCTQEVKYDYAIFSGCTKLVKVEFGNNVKTIPDFAFEDCRSLTSVTIPDSVTSIGSYAFAYCSSLTSITIPDSVTYIGYKAFEGCFKLVEVYNLSKLTISAGSSGNGYVAYYVLNVYTSLSEKSKLATTSDGYIFYEDGDIVYLIGDTGTQTSLSFPNNYNGKNYEIYQYAFSISSSLTSVTIGNGVTSIGKYAFYGCSSLSSVTIGNGVTSIGSYAFEGCRSLTDIYFNGTKSQWNAISKGYWWNTSTGNYTIHCTDGDISK